MVDEEKLRKSAILAGFAVMGIVGLLLLAKDLGLIKEVRSYLYELQRKQFRISKRIMLEVLKKVGENH